MSSWSLLPDGRPRHATGAFVEVARADRRVHLDHLADASELVATAVAIGVPTRVEVPDSVTDEGLDAFLCVVYGSAPPVAVLPTLDAIDYFQARPNVVASVDNYFAAHSAALLDHAAECFDDLYAQAFRISTALPRTWAVIRRVRRPSDGTRTPKHPAAYRALRLIPENCTFHLTLKEIIDELRVRRRVHRRRVRVPRLREFAVKALLADDALLVQAAMNEPMSALIDVFDAATAISRRCPREVRFFEVKTTGEVLCCRSMTQVMPPVIPRVRMNCARPLSSWPNVNLPFEHLHDALRLHDDLAHLFLNMPPRLEQALVT